MIHTKSIFVYNFSNEYTGNGEPEIVDLSWYFFDKHYGTLLNNLKNSVPSKMFVKVLFWSI